MRRAIISVGAAAALSVLPAVPAAASGGGGCGQATTEGAGDAVAISQFCFEPTVLYAETGQSVTFTNRDAVRHNVLGASATWGSFETLREGQMSRYAFDQPGVYPYVCAWHPGMVGAVVVGSGQPTRLLADTQEAAPTSRSRATGGDTPWKAVAAASAGLLVLVVIGASGRRRSPAA